MLSFVCAVSSVTSLERQKSAGIKIAGYSNDIPFVSVLSDFSYLFRIAFRIDFSMKSNLYAL